MNLGRAFKAEVLSTGARMVPHRLDWSVCCHQSIEARSKLVTLKKNCPCEVTKTDMEARREIEISGVLGL